MIEDYRMKITTKEVRNVTSVIDDIIEEYKEKCDSERKLGMEEDALQICS